MKKCYMQRKGYTITELLGIGSYGRVYKVQSIPASNGVSSETLAVKCVERHLLAQRKSAEDGLINEIGILKMLKHPNIVGLKDFSWDDKYIYLVLEYCTLGDLSKVLAKHHRLNEEITGHFLRQVASALCFLRNYNISHFDLKPQNILLTCNPQVTLKLADFGFATVISSEGFMKGYRGTPLYMAPEMLVHHIFTPKADLWSVGVMLYECLVGVTPFAADSIITMAARLRNVRHVHLPEVPISKECGDLLSKLLQVDPVERIDFKDFFFHPFVNIQQLSGDAALKKGSAKIAGKAVRAQRAHLTDDVRCDALKNILPFSGRVGTQTGVAGLPTYAFGCLKEAEKLNLLIPNSNNVHKDVSMERLWADSPQIQACLTLVTFADSLAAEGKLATAIEKYDLIILSSQMVLSRSIDTSSEKRNLLKEHIRQWVSKRDAIRYRLDHTSDPTENSEKDDTASSSAARCASRNHECTVM
ncbi:Pkinase domain containing protein [Trichuris trichiura]|uniref:non-specific serine/threonine protein kinase n=1 Tax=Trichuris trichiura TaxID=36087 RepID=A0A077Z3I6_TRITR|nr:Pkinase domain containing protein [Trichuris trichiura]